MSKYLCKCPYGHGDCEFDEVSYFKWNKRCIYAPNTDCYAEFKEIPSLEIVSNAFWNDLFKRTYHDSDKFTTQHLRCNIADKNDIKATFEICRNIAWRLCGCSSIFACQFKKLPFSNSCFNWLVLGRGEPQTTSKYGYCYFDFSKELVYIVGSDVEERLITLQKAFEKLYK